MNGSWSRFSSPGPFSPYMTAKWWEEDSYCYNPVGYFYKKWVHQKCILEPSNHYDMDYDFLTKVSSIDLKYKRINKLSGVFNCRQGCKTETTLSKGMVSHINSVKRKSAYRVASRLTPEQNLLITLGTEIYYLLAFCREKYIFSSLNNVQNTIKWSYSDYRIFKIVTKTKNSFSRIDKVFLYCPM